MGSAPCRVPTDFYFENFALSFERHVFHLSGSRSKYGFSKRLNSGNMEQRFIVNERKHGFSIAGFAGCNPGRDDTANGGFVFGHVFPRLLCSLALRDSSGHARTGRVVFAC